MNNITSVGANNYLSFGANFENHTSDSIYIAGGTIGNIGLKQIKLSGIVDVANLGSAGNYNYWVDLFTNPSMALEVYNLDTFRLVYKGDEFKLEQDGGRLSITEGTGGKNYIIYVPVNDTLDMEQTDLDGVSNQGIYLTTILLS